ncbi:hypothetical protein Tco_0887553 [Tanacetum coccineum]
MSSPNHSTSDFEDAFLCVLEYSLTYTSGAHRLVISQTSSGGDKMYLKHHEKQIEDILNYLDDSAFNRIEGKWKIIKLQRKKLGQKDKIAFAHYRISNLEQIIEKIQDRHQMDQEDL